MFYATWTIRVLFLILAFIYIVYIAVDALRREITILGYKSEKLEVNSLKKNNFLPWYFKNGTIRPTVKDKKGIWPNETAEDRVLTQLMYVPSKKTLKTKTIFLVHVRHVYVKIEMGKKIFTNLKCPVDDCHLIENRNEADAVVFGNKQPEERNSTVSPKQIWIFYILENPTRPYEEYGIAKGINWTATYRRDSDIEVPYGKWLYYNESVKTRIQEKNYAAGKKKKVAWFVSNCKSYYNGRLEYANELKKYIQVDIYGKCGDLECPRKNESECLKMLTKDYKFYLAFENANCKDYITEKLFLNSLRSNVLPIVMGAHPNTYEQVAPYNSFIHVDHFASPKDLADYLHVLDKNDYLYNAYFQWKGTGEFINTYFFCRLCAMLHSDYPVKSYDNFTKWWKDPKHCVKGSWLKTE